MKNIPKLYLTEIKEKKEAIKIVEKWIDDLGFRTLLVDKHRPWGAFWHIEKYYHQKFKKMFFPEINLNSDHNLSAKFLLVEPHQKLSFQWHGLRDEVWKVVFGRIKIALSPTDEIPKENQLKIHKEGKLIEIKRKERHQLIGTDNWSLVAEIWQHCNPNCPSSEEDIVRVKDEYSRV